MVRDPPHSHHESVPEFGNLQRNHRRQNQPIQEMQDLAVYHWTEGIPFVGKTSTTAAAVELNRTPRRYFSMKVMDWRRRVED